MNPVEDCIYGCTLAGLVKPSKLEKEIGCVLKRVIAMPLALLVRGVLRFY